jgi:hypothetical protein
MYIIWSNRHGVYEVFDLLEGYAKLFGSSDVLEQPIGPVFKSQSVWTSYPKKAGNYQSTLTF